MCYAGLHGKKEKINWSSTLVGSQLLDREEALDWCKHRRSYVEVGSNINGET